MKRIFLTLLILLFFITPVLSITPEDLFKKPLTVQLRARSLALSTTYKFVPPGNQQGIILERENGIWDKLKPTKERPDGFIWFYNIDLKTAQPYIDEFERTLKKVLDKVIEPEIKIVIGFWLPSEEILIYFGDLSGSKEFYEYMLERIIKGE